MSIRDILIEESQRLDEIITMAMEDLEKAPQGSLLSVIIRGKVRFYMYTQAKKKVYLSKNRDRNIISALAQKMYARKVLKIACKQKVILNRFLAEYDPHSVSRIFIDGRHDGLFSPYVKEPPEEEPFSLHPTPALDLELVSQLKDICSRLLGN